MKRVLVGVDAGATKTLAVVADESLNELGRGVAGPGNPNNVGYDGMIEAIRYAVEQALMEAGVDSMPDACCVASAGLDCTRVWREVEARLQGLNLASKLVVEHDAFAALMAATEGGPGCILIAGTGSIALAWNGAERVIVGDRGYLLGDVGSGYWLGLQALRLAVAALDGREPGARMLAEKMLRAVGVRDVDELTYKVYHGGWSSVDRVASLAPLVVEEALHGDPYASRIVEEGARELARCARIAVEKARLEDKTVYYSGGLAWSRGFEEKLRAALIDAGLWPERVPREPVYGALIIARKALEESMTLGEKPLR